MRVPLTRLVGALAKDEQMTQMDTEKDAEIRRLTAALKKIADYSPASTIQPVQIARAALKGKFW